MSRKVLITYKIMPKSTETDLEKIKKKIKEVVNDIGEIKDIKEEPIAFGLKALKVLIMVEDKQGISDILEETISSIEDIESVESESITLI